MNKKLIALAVAGMFAPAVALAQGTNVTIYGTLNADFENVEADGATPLATFALPGAPAAQPGAGVNTKSRNRVSSNSSNIGFRVREDLGGGMTAWAQCESSANVDAGGGTLCSRNTGLGVEGAWGNLFLGQWDTPYKSSTGGLDPMGNVGVAQYVGIMGSPGLNVASGTFANGGTNTSGAFGFDRRAQNSVAYWTPNWSGFSAKLQYAANEEKTILTAATSVAPQFSPQLWSANIVYDNGPLYITAAYEKHDDFIQSAANFANLNPVIGTNVVSGSDDDAWKIGVGYKFGNFQIVGMYEELEYKVDTTLGTFDAKREAWMVGANYLAGAWQLGASYMDADKLDCSGLVVATACADTGANMWAVRVGYSLSKRTQVYALYTQIDNDQFAQYNFGTNAVPGAYTGFNAGITPGADPQAYAIGLKHTF